MRAYILYLEIFLNRAERSDSLSLPETLKSLSDPIRRDILDMLREGKKTAGEISDHFDLTPATVSYHLSLLKKSELVVQSKYKNFIYYELNASMFEELLTWIYGFQKGEHYEK